MVDQPRTFDPLASVDIREAARFAMRRVEDQSRVLNRIHRLIDLGSRSSARCTTIRPA